MLILDGHGSHVTPDFINYCDSHRILLTIFPPHATHNLQPLDVVLFSPLAAAYSKELEDLLHRSQGLLNVQKSDFIRLFWAAYTSSFTVDNILSSFPATGVHPREPDVVLKRFKTPPPPPQRDTNSDFGEEIDSNSWRQVVGLFDAAVPDKSKVEAKQLKQLLHNYQIHNQLYRREIDELRNEITTKNSKKKEQKELKAAAAAHKKQITAEAKQLCEVARIARQKEREARAAQLAAARAQKEQDRVAATTKKSHDKQNTPKRKALSSQNPPTAERRRGAGAQSGDGIEPPPAKPLTKITTRGRIVKLPKKYDSPHLHQTSFKQIPLRRRVPKPLILRIHLMKFLFKRPPKVFN
ncbi:DDE 1 domain containing protein [Pyrenophora teres f. teres]|uniref:DDE 1 domain containing protein n=1 Tax=Pyrenophora teres f. teres TaxID=97479 RepID=A0A6S6W1K7_9PLEO|nr:DDE 1 domain containing protein [Pyrenophora teres f. teres]CAE7221304.1 DDE 1 domain containing protein [Pyrenophora teres f. teres]